MRTYSRRTLVRAPLSAVWTFHSHVAGLTVVTPSFLDLRVDDVRVPADPETGTENGVDDAGADDVGIVDGEADDPTTDAVDADAAALPVDVRGPVLEAGTEVDGSMKPLGVGPRLSWTSRITERESGEDRAHFADEMLEGPFAHWAHTHRFVAAEEGTVIADRVTYELPGATAGRVADRLAVVGLDPMFRFRHRRTRELLE